MAKKSLIEKIRNQLNILLKSTQDVNVVVDLTQYTKSLNYAEFVFVN